MPTSAPPVLVVFSHLRWSFVFQRPQQLLSRLAGRWRVLYVEEPQRLPAGDEQPRLEVHPHGPHLSVLVPHTPVAAPGFHDDQIAVIEPLLAAYLREQKLPLDVAWLYTPMALPLAEALVDSLTHKALQEAGTALVYDCMDELSAFKDAPRQLRQREGALLKRADVVLTGGPSLYEARRSLHANVHCVPSSVDPEHFSPLRLVPHSEPAQAATEAMAAIPHPRLGFFGVIDERLDAALVGALADAHPHWQIVMVGPVVKIDPATLPQRPNIHWLGMQSYARLPYLLAHWDVALMPFALNEATRFISPTKTLEYMAGEKPVVSTAIRDVISLYGHAVEVARDPAGFIRACERVLAEGPDARCQRVLDMLTTVAMHSWDRSADTVHGLLAQALAERRAAALRSLQPPATALASAAAAGSAALPLVAAGGARA